MSVLKLKWIDLCIENDFGSIFDDMSGELEDVDELFAEKFGEDSSPLGLSALYETVLYSYLLQHHEHINLWKDMPIYVSSYKRNDLRVVNEISRRLWEYLGFYKKILTDDGVARKVITHRTFANNGSSSGNYKNYESDTPQTQLTNFDDAIDYASRLEKNEDSRETSKAGVTDYDLKSFNWDEALKNLKMVFYNDLCRYINSIPVLLYNYYALDEYPVSESIKEYFHTLKTIRDL